MPQGIIDPTIGASEYGANIAQWDWKPFSDAMNAAKTTYAMVQGNKEEKRKQEEMEMEKILFPTKQKLLELELSKTQAEIGRTNAMTDYYLGQNDASNLLNSPYGDSALRSAYAPVFGNDPIFGFGESNAAPVKPSTPTSGISGAGFNSY